MSVHPSEYADISEDALLRSYRLLTRNQKKAVAFIAAGLPNHPDSPQAKAKARKAKAVRGPVNVIAFTGKWYGKRRRRSAK